MTAEVCFTWLSWRSKSTTFTGHEPDRLRGMFSWGGVQPPLVLSYAPHPKGDLRPSELRRMAMFVVERRQFLPSDSGISILITEEVSTGL